jgi:hypothetical protein
MTDTTLTPSRLWKLMTAEQRLRAAQALWGEEEAKDDQAQAASLIAQQKKFRPKTVNALDKDRKARYLASVANVPEALAARLLVLYHLAAQRPMMGAFLDAIGLAHENGMIQEDAVAPDPAKVATAATAVAGAYPAHDVALYLNTLLWQDPVSWGVLQGLPEVSLS